MAEQEQCYNLSKTESFWLIDMVHGVLNKGSSGLRIWQLTVKGVNEEQSSLQNHNTDFRWCCGLRVSLKIPVM